MLDKVVYDRIMAALNFEEGDRVPIWDYIDNRAVYRYFADDEPDYLKGMVKVYHGLGIDLCRGFGASFDESQEGQRGENWMISGMTRWLTKRPINSIEDLKRYQPHELTEEEVERWVQHQKAMQRAFEPYTMWVPGAGCGFDATYMLMGLELFSYAIYEAREHLERIMWTLSENGAKLARAAAKEKLCPIFFTWSDIAYKDRLMVSPEFLRQTFIPCLRKVVEPLKEAGIKVIFHSDGNVMEILDDMIEVGIDGLNPIEPLAGMDIGYLKRRYYGRLVLVGNVDCSQVLPLGTPEEVVEAVKECIRVASPGGGHLMGSSSEIVPATPLENVLIFYDAIKRYGRYPIRL